MDDYVTLIKEYGKLMEIKGNLLGATESTRDLGLAGMKAMNYNLEKEYIEELSELIDQRSYKIATYAKMAKDGVNLFRKKSQNFPDLLANAEDDCRELENICDNLLGDIEHLKSL